MCFNIDLNELDDLVDYVEVYYTDKEPIYYMHVYYVMEIKFRG